MKLVLAHTQGNMIYKTGSIDVVGQRNRCGSLNMVMCTPTLLSYSVLWCTKCSYNKECVPVQILSIAFQKDCMLVFSWKVVGPFPYMYLSYHLLHPHKSIQTNARNTMIGKWIPRWNSLGWKERILELNLKKNGSTSYVEIRQVQNGVLYIRFPW